MSDSFYVGGYWDARREDVDECTARLLEFVLRLGTRHRLLATWFELGNSLEEALKRQVEPTYASLRQYLLDGRSRDDTSEHHVIEDLGYRFSAWNGLVGSEGGLSVQCGCYSERTGNNCLVDLPKLSADSDALYHRETGRLLMTDVVECWEPDWATFTGRDLRDNLEAEGPPQAVGWMTYLSAELEAHLTESLSGHETERLGEGVLITLGDDPAAVTADEVIDLRQRLEPGA